MTVEKFIHCLYLPIIGGELYKEKNCNFTKVYNKYFMLALLSSVRKGFLGKLLHTNKDIIHTQHLIKSNPDSHPDVIVIDEVIKK